MYDKEDDDGISIHPPARGGTVVFAEQISPCSYFNPPTRKGWDHSNHRLSQAEKLISIHPPARGGTGISQVDPKGVGDFNPPTRKGWDSPLAIIP